MDDPTQDPRLPPDGQMGQEQAGEQMPPDPNMPPEAGEPLDPYSTADEETQLQALQEELENAKETIKDDFAKYAAERFEATPELEEMFFNDKQEFFKTIVQLQEDYLEANIKSKLAQAEQLQNSIHTKKTGAEFSKAKSEFLSQYPDENVEGLVAFAQEAIPPKQLAELTQLPMGDFLRAVKQIKDSGGESNPASEGAGLPRKLPISPTNGGSMMGNGGKASVFNRP
ncbi:hypothetical protein [Helicobacter sp. 11S02596-1]|uniref:hypothetical protein n=1 Tax=Helicobacter sp. 11S02596-1 TaxID=1476194 RepID=UPI000BA64B93|nr:hypothetical protein [Helicobacter sp. 11S02596-1]PAF41371.1 hypothetical protein BJI48_08755 [Helicobacter sp. 11S02596-1]